MPNDYTVLGIKRQGEKGGILTAMITISTSYPQLSPGYSQFCKVIPIL